MEVKVKVGNAFKNIYWPIVIIAIIQKFVSPEAFFLINLAWLFCMILAYKKAVVNPIWGFWVMWVFLFVGAVLGIHILASSNRDFVRDFFYYINPMIYIYAGAMYAKTGVDFDTFSNSIIIGELVQAFSFILTFIQEGRAPEGISSFFWMPLALLLINRFDKERSFKPVTRIILLIIYMTAALLTFSRTTLVMVLCVFIFGSTLHFNAKKALKLIVVLIVMLCAGLYVFFNIVPKEDQEMFTKKFENSQNEMNPFQNWRKEEIVTKSWRGYENSCVIKEFQKGNVIENFFGYGFGKRIEVGRYSTDLLLQRTEEGKSTTSIAITHNGYANILIKLGILGLVLLLYFYINIFIRSMRFAKKFKSVEARVLAGIVVGLLIETLFMNGIFRDVCFYGTVTAIGLIGYRIKNHNEFDEHDSVEEEEEEEEEEEKQSRIKVKFN